MTIQLTTVQRLRLSWLFVVLSLLGGLGLAYRTEVSMAAMAAVSQDATLYKDIMRTDDFAVVAVDTSGKIVLWNHGAEKLFGWSKSEIVGQKMYKLLPEPLVTAHKKIFEGSQAAVMQQAYVHHTVRCMTQDKSGRPIDVVLNIRTLPGAKDACMLVSIDSAALHTGSAVSAAPVTSASE